MSVLPAGSPVPSFRLARADGETFTEADLLGRRSVLVFYPFAFSPVCTDQLQLYEPLTRELAEARGRVVRRLVRFHLGPERLSREARGHQRAAVGLRAQGWACRAFGVLHEGGFPQRALVVTGPDGVVGWSYQADSPGELPGLDLLRTGLR